MDAVAVCAVVFESCCVVCFLFVFRFFVVDFFHAVAAYVVDFVFHFAPLLMVKMFLPLTRSGGKNILFEYSFVAVFSMIFFFIFCLTYAVFDPSF